MLNRHPILRHRAEAHGHPHPSPRSPRPSAQAGVTLTELLVVLALLGAIAAIALPNFERMTASVARDTEREHILNQLAELGPAAMLDGLDYVVLGSDTLDDDALADALVGRTRYPLDVPDGWEVVVDEPILARANGVCLGGRATLMHEELIEPFYVELTAPFCRVDVDDSEPPRG